MKYASNALTKVKSDNENKTFPSLEGLVPDLSQYANRHSILEAAKTLNSGSHDTKLMTALLIESIAPEAVASLESIDEMDSAVSLEAAQEANLNKAKQESSKFSSGLIGWIKKTFSDRGKFFSDLDKVIAEVQVLKGGGFELNESDKKRFGELIGYYNTSLLKAIEETANVFDVISNLSFKRAEAALSAMKSGTGFIRSYDGILRNYGSGISKELNQIVSTKTSNFLGSKIFVLTRTSTTIGETSFLGNIIGTDISDITMKDGSPIEDIRTLAVFYEKLSKESYVTVSKLMSPKLSKLPEKYDDVLSLLEATRNLMDNVIDVDRIKALKNIVDEEQKFIGSQKVANDELFASWMMCNSNVATASVFYQFAEKEYRQVAGNIINFARAAISAKK